jgi:glutathione S-transferase
MLSKELLFPALATLIAMFVYNLQIFYVVKARSKYGIRPPAITGNENFDRAWRVHYNTLEQLPFFLSTLWIFALTVSATVAGWLGLVWSFGRLAYMYGYYKSNETRNNPISVLSSLVTIMFLFGSLWAVVSGLLR